MIMPWLFKCSRTNQRWCSCSSGHELAMEQAPTAMSEVSVMMLVGESGFERERRV